MNDHDLLTEIATKLKVMANDFRKLDANNRQAHKDIIEKIEKHTDNLHERIDKQVKESAEQIQECNGKFIHSKVFYFIMAALIGVIISLGGYAAVNRNDIIELKTLENIHHGGNTHPR
jgi:hypothetical protein